jgi:hypothetical protein
MAFFTKAEARSAAGRAMQKEPLKKSFHKAIYESVASTKDYDRFDVFMSHSLNDAELVIGIKKILEENGLRVYVDWQEDPELSREDVTKETAEVLRKRMKQSTSMIYVATDNASRSKWMPWEVGFFDAFSNGCVAVLPLLEDANAIFKGQEYIGLYPLVTKDVYSNSATEDVFVEERGVRWTTLRRFVKGSPPWHKYSYL